MEDNSGKKFSLQDWVMKRAANQSGGAMPSQASRQILSEREGEVEIHSSQHEVSLEVEMKAVSNGSAISSLSPSVTAQAASYAPKPKEEKPPIEPPLSKKEETKDLSKDHKDSHLLAESTLSASAAAQSPLQQLQIVRLLTDLGDRLRQSEKEREILWKEVEICRKQISEMSGNAGKTEKSFSDMESQINQREVFVKELVEKQIGLEQKLKDQLEAFDASKQEQSKLQDKLNSVETATGSAIVRVEDAMAENAKLSKRVEQLGQDKARLVRKLEIVEETLTQTQDILKAKALVLLTDSAVAALTNLRQTPAWTGDDTLKVSQAAAAPKNGEKLANNNPVSSITASLRPKAGPSMFLITVVTAIIAGIAAFGVIWAIKYFSADNQTDPVEQVESISSQISKGVSPPAKQNDLMAEAAKAANQIEPGSLSDSEMDVQEDAQATTADLAEEPVFDVASSAQDKAVQDFKSEAPTTPLSERIKPDKSLSKAVAEIEKRAFSGDAYAQHDLAAIYTSGHAGVKLDYAKAAKWFEEAAHNGASNAQYNLGVLYHQGLGVQKNTAKAIELYRVAASNNHPEALYNLAIAYVEGVGVEYNPQIAATYFERSADGGIVEAAYNLGLLQENGLLGESQPDEAIFWYKIAADKGNQDALKSLNDLKKKLSMTNDDVNRLAQKIAATKPGYLNDDGKASLPEQVKPDVKSVSDDVVPVKEKKSQANLPAKKAVGTKSLVDPVIISQIQEQLMRLELYKGIPNGTVSPALVQAIRAYQGKNGLKVDGQPSDDLLVQMLVSGSEGKDNLSESN